MSESGWQVGTDIGGTFTDIVAIGPGETRIGKVPSRADDPVRAMMEAIAALGLRRDQVSRFVHGTTRITNAIVEERLPRVALIATAGFEDVLEIGRYRRRDLYRLDIAPKPSPLVPPELCFGLRERLDHNGAVLQAPDEAEIERLLLWLEKADVQSVAVALLHAYANPVHERLLAARLQGRVVHLCLSHEINPEAREYERTTSCVLNACAMPIAVDYLEALERELPLGPGLLVFHSAGGMIPVPAARKRPIVMAMSGPAAGVSACTGLARQLDLSRVLTFDMGGTTTDVCLITDGIGEMTDTRMIEGRPLRQPMLAVHSIGAGGGSIVGLGPGGLSVGPESAGADPGPACYGLGGTRATITDANALLGLLDPEVVLGGRIRIDLDAAARAIAPIAGRLGLSVTATCLGILQVANATMARALRRVTVERGVDGRDCTLLAFGGGGPMHAAGLAEMYGISSVLVPVASSAFSALGCLVADISFLQQQTFRTPLADLQPEPFAARLRELECQVIEPLVANGIDPAEIELEAVAMMRYSAQSEATAVPFTRPLDPAALEAAFQARHRQLYGYATAEPCVIEAVRLRSRKPASTIIPRPTQSAPRLAGSRLCSFDNAHDVPTAILDRNALAGPVHGPAILHDDWSTIVVPPSWQARVDGHGHLWLSKAA